MNFRTMELPSCNHSITSDCRNLWWPLLYKAIIHQVAQDSQVSCHPEDVEPIASLRNLFITSYLIFFLTEKLKRERAVVICSLYIFFFPEHTVHLFSDLAHLISNHSWNTREATIEYFILFSLKRNTLIFASKLFIMTATPNVPFQVIIPKVSNYFFPDETTHSKYT